MFGQAGGVGMGGLIAGSLLGSVADTVLGSMIAREFFAGEGHGAGLSHASEPGQEEGSTDKDQAMDDGDTSTRAAVSTTSRSTVAARPREPRRKGPGVHAILSDNPSPGLASH
jgi:hypothetical protein